MRDGGDWIGVFSLWLKRFIVEVYPQVAVVKSTNLDRPSLGCDGSGCSCVVVGHFDHRLRPGHDFFLLLRSGKGVVSLAIVEHCRVGAVIILIGRIGREYFLI